MHYYQDTSHFRAPYQNMAVQGLGDAPPNGAVTPENINQVSEVGTDGVRRYTEGWRATIMGMLAAYRYVFITNTQVRLVPITAAEMTAAQADPAAAALIESMRADKWVAAKVGENYAVMVPFTLLWDSAAALASPAGLQIGATAAADKAAMKAASEFPTPEMPLGAYVAEPSMIMPRPGYAVREPAEAGLTPILWAAGIILVLGGGAYALTRQRRARVGGRAVPASPRGY